MAGKIVLVATLFLLFTVIHREQASLPTTHAATERAFDTLEENRFQVTTVHPPPQTLSELPPVQNQFHPLAPEQSCYAYMLRRPGNQRAEAVQARLKQADRMTSAFESHLLTVDILGDHANILSLEFPAVWPDKVAYVRRVSSVVDDYFSSPEIEDYLCQSGFAEVRLSARGLNDQRTHPVWRARVTSVGLLKSGGDGDRPASPALLSLSSGDEPALASHH